jgi:hypothetical protein
MKLKIKLLEKNDRLLKRIVLEEFYVPLNEYTLASYEKFLYYQGSDPTSEIIYSFYANIFDFIFDRSALLYYKNPSLGITEQSSFISDSIIVIEKHTILSKNTNEDSISYCITLLSIKDEDVDDRILMKRFSSEKYACKYLFNHIRIDDYSIRLLKKEGIINEDYC